MPDRPKKPKYRRPDEDATGRNKLPPGIDGDSKAAAREDRPGDADLRRENSDGIIEGDEPDPVDEIPAAFDNVEYEDVDDDEGDDADDDVDEDDVEDEDDDEKPSPSPRPVGGGSLGTIGERLGLTKRRPERVTDEAPPAVSYFCWPLNDQGQRVKDDLLVVVGRRTREKLKEEVSRRSSIGGAWEYEERHKRITGQGTPRERVVRVDNFRFDEFDDSPEEQEESAPPMTWPEPPIPDFSRNPYLDRDRDDRTNMPSGEDKIEHLMRWMTDQGRLQAEQQREMLTLIRSQQQTRSGTETLDRVVDLAIKALPLIQALRPPAAAPTPAEEVFKAFERGMDARDKAGAPRLGKDMMGPALIMLAASSPKLAAIFERMFGGAEAMQPPNGGVVALPPGLPQPAQPNLLPAPAPAPMPPMPAPPPAAVPVQPQPQPQPVLREPPPYTTETGKQWRQSLLWSSLNRRLGSERAHRYSRAEYWAEIFFTDVPAQVSTDLVGLDPAALVEEILEVGANVRARIVETLSAEERKDADSENQNVRAKLRAWAETLIREIKTKLAEETEPSGEAGQNE